MNERCILLITIIINYHYLFRYIKFRDIFVIDEQIFTITDLVGKKCQLLKPNRKKTLNIMFSTYYYFPLFVWRRPKCQMVYFFFGQ